MLGVVPTTRGTAQTEKTASAHSYTPPLPRPLSTAVSLPTACHRCRHCLPHHTRRVRALRHARVARPRVFRPCRFTNGFLHDCSATTSKAPPSRHLSRGLPHLCSSLKFHTAVFPFHPLLLSTPLEPLSPPQPPLSYSFWGGCPDEPHPCPKKTTRGFDHRRGTPAPSCSHR